MKMKNITINNANKNYIPVLNTEATEQDITAPQTAELSFFDIKEMYDRAYTAIEAGRDDYKAKEIMAEAIKMDMAYRCQLARKSTYKKQSRLNDFKITSKQTS